MKNIILQHYNGEMGELEKLSQANIMKYAEKVGADYKLITGKPFNQRLSNPCQKLHMLDEEFDDYDIVLMVDPDMFTRKGMDENVFEVPGIGMGNTKIQNSLHGYLCKNVPGLTSKNHPFWGGAIWKLTREQRKIFRNTGEDLEDGVKQQHMIRVSKVHGDEGIMHYLAKMADFNPETPYLPGYNKWCHGSYEDYRLAWDHQDAANIEDSAMIHIRTKYWISEQTYDEWNATKNLSGQQPRKAKKGKDQNFPLQHREKIKNYYDLVERGLIEGE